MEIADLEAEAAELVFPRFDEATALALGLRLVDLAQAAAAPVVINIRTATRTLFHAALPGAAPLNDLWALRKSNTVLTWQMASMQVALRMAGKADALAHNGLNSATHALSGGAVPVTVAGVGVVAVATVSGLPQEDDHRLVVRAMRAVLAAG